MDPRSSGPSGSFILGRFQNRSGAQPMHRTDDLRIRNITASPLAAGRCTRNIRSPSGGRDRLTTTRHEIQRILHGERRPAAGGGRPLLGPRPPGRAGICRASQAGARGAERAPADGDARLFRETAHHGRLEGADQRPEPGRQLRDQQGAGPRPQAAAGSQRDGHPGGHRIPRSHQPPVHRRPGELGGDRRPHHREPGPPRTGLRPVLPGRLQERHQRRRARSPSTPSTPRRGRMSSCP